MFWIDNNFILLSQIQYNVIKNINKFKLIGEFNIDDILNWKKYEYDDIYDHKFNCKKPKEDSVIMGERTFVESIYQRYVYLGYKIRLAGRFTRRVKKVIFWVNRGLTPLHAHSKLLDYGNFVDIGTFSSFSARLWLFKNNKFKHNYDFIF